MTDDAAPAAGTADWRINEGGVVLIGSRCASCGLQIFPVKAFCPRCGGDDTAPVALSRLGRLYSYSTIHIAPAGLTTPYTVGVVDLEEGIRVFAQIEGAPGSFELDAVMEPVLGVIRTEQTGPVMGYKFRKAV